MLRYLVLLAVAVCPMLAAAALAVRVYGGMDAVGAVESVSTLSAQLEEHPAALLNRIVRVRGIAYGRCADTVTGPDGPCPAWAIDLLDTAPGVDVRITLIQEPPLPLVTRLRRWSLLAPLLPTPQVVLFGRPTVYRVQARQSACVAADPAPCFEVVLADAVL